MSGVSSQETDMRAAVARVLMGILLAPLLLSQHVTWAETSSSLCQRIAKADPKKYRAIQDARDWHNPQVVVRPEGIEVIGVTSAGQSIPVELVPEKLEHLPHSAWPYGLVIMVSDSGILSSPKNLPRIQANRSELLELLKKHCIAVDLWPSA
jgi:hypothetical protein